MASLINQGTLTVITGPSGVGKGTLVKLLLESHPEIWLSISATTRLSRSGEVEGKHYFFLTRDKFLSLIKKDGFIEWAEFAGNLYGTPKSPLEKILNSGQSVLLEIELEGARQIRNNFKQAKQIFISPPNFEELEKRIRGRATDSEEAILKRLLRAKEEIKAQEEFDAILVNDDLKKSLAQLEKIMNL